MNPAKYLATFLSFNRYREVSKDSGLLGESATSPHPAETPHPPGPFLYPAHAAAAFVETASFCVRIAQEDFAIATDVRAHITELGCPATL